MSDDRPGKRVTTETSSFGVGRRESHDSSAFYSRFRPPAISSDETVNHAAAVQMHPESVCLLGSSVATGLPDNSVALVVTSPPYFVGKDYELAVEAGQGADDRGIPQTYLDYLQVLRDVFAESARVLEPGGRIAVNIANLGRKPYRSLSSDVTAILQDELGLLLRGEVIWQKGKSSSGSCAWGSFAKATNPVLRDITERVVIASKGRFSRALTLAERERRGLPHRSTLSNDEFVDVTRDVWEIDSESASRVGHPAPFPIDLPRRLIELYTYEGDVVLDPFAGAGTAMVAAIRTGRIGLGFDLDPDYVELSNRRMDAERGRLAERSLDGDHRPSADERQDLRHDLAVDAGRKMLDLATAQLEDAGFSVSAKGTKLTPLGIEFDLIATGGDSSTFFVDVSGGFTAVKPGLQRTESLWKSLARVHVLRSSRPDARVLLLTSSRPKAGTPAAKALEAACVDDQLQVFELFDPEDLARLEQLA